MSVVVRPTTQATTGTGGTVTRIGALGGQRTRQGHHQRRQTGTQTNAQTPHRLHQRPPRKANNNTLQTMRLHRRVHRRYDYVKRLLYLLHIAEPNGEIWHYAGTTTPDRFEDRLREHCGEVSPNANSPPKAALQRGAQVCLAAIINPYNSWDEHRLHRNLHGPKAPVNAKMRQFVVQHCDICNATSSHCVSTGDAWTPLKPRPVMFIYPCR
jgi:hypothetical protein